MKKMKQLKTKMILSIVSILTVASLLTVVVFSTFAWFTINDKAVMNGFNLSTSNDTFMEYGSVIKAVRTNLNGSFVTNTYSNVDGKLKIKTSTIQESIEDEPTNNLPNELGNFLFAEMLPGEYVDISVPYRVTKVPEYGFKYSISLTAFNKTGSFVVPYNNVDYTHYVLGVFKYRPISLNISYNDERDDYLYIFPEDEYDYKWLSSYTLNEDDKLPSAVYIFKDHEFSTYLSTYRECTLTFRIYESFDQYFDLIKESGTYQGNLLSQKTFSIGNLLFNQE